MKIPESHSHPCTPNCQTLVPELRLPIWMVLESAYLDALSGPLVCINRSTVGVHDILQECIVPRGDDAQCLPQCDGSTHPKQRFKYGDIFLS